MARIAERELQFCRNTYSSAKPIPLLIALCLSLIASLVAARKEQAVDTKKQVIKFLDMFYAVY